MAQAERPPLAETLAFLFDEFDSNKDGMMSRKDFFHVRGTRGAGAGAGAINRGACANGATRAPRAGLGCRCRHSSCGASRRS